MIDHPTTSISSSSMSAQIPSTSQPGETIPTSASHEPYRVAVAMNNTGASYHALDTAVSICARFAPHTDYKIYVVHVVALNPPQSIPYLDHLERAYNLEIRATAEAEVEACRKYLESKYADRINYEFLQVEGEGDTGSLVLAYVEGIGVDLLVVGSRALGNLKRTVLGSVSDHCVHHASVPVLVVKSDE
ncbi:hypothetical protein BJ742DRAFT_166173 [Cladochytrium replicatum]|nr:hypothetical protein BJ742DRAFT_166173 [Cladochytrium replicatum]